MSRLSALVLVVLFAGCAPDPEDTTAARTDDIVGGIALLDGGYPAVYMIHSAYNNGLRAACSATLITPRTLLTAAHCVDPRKAGATSSVIYFEALAVAPPPDGGVWAPVVDSRFHPLYNPSDLFNYDIAVVLLPTSQTVTPIPHNTASVSGLVGQPLTAVGYGVTAEGAGNPGTRRMVDLTFRSVTATHIALGDQVSKGICDGDSGGPSLYLQPDGGLTVVGIHSYKVPGSGCTDGLDTRVDIFAAFLQQWLDEKEPDAGAPDAGVPPVDAGVPLTDAGVADAGAPVTDAGQPVTDAGQPGTDAGTNPQPDAGTQPDPDAGTQPQADGGTTTLPPVDPNLGKCGCAGAPGAPLLLLALALRRRRR